MFAIEHTGIEPFGGHMQLEAEADVHFRPVEPDHEAERVRRVREACQRKYPKLARWKRDRGARTVLVLEENDIQLTNQQVVADALLEVEKTMPDRPDEVYLVSTAIETPWWTFALRVGMRDYYDFSRALECMEEIDSTTLVDITGR